MATFNVMTTVDENNVTGELSLREAIITANGAIGDDTIVLVGGETYQLSLPGRNEDKSLTGDLDILSAGGKITILGQPDNKATINGSEIDGVFDVESFGSLSLKNIVITGGDNSGGITSSGDLVLEYVTVTNNSGAGINLTGNSSNAITEIMNSIISNNSGRGIRSSGHTTITNSIISNNDSGGMYYVFGDGNDGGGIDQSGSTSSLTVINSTIINNTATGRGGGINTINGLTNIINTVISGNVARGSSGGGGINQIGMNSLKIINSTISGNLATGNSSSGGGIRSTNTLSIENSTISGNTASQGGGMYVDDVVNVNNSTITNNDATQGSGLVISTSTTKASFSNSIVAGNKQNLDISNLSNNLISQGNNLISNATGLETVFNKTGDKVGSVTNPLDAVLGPLQNNGGISATHALLAGSPAINAGNSTLIKDQRGFGRNGLPDIGAFEFEGINDSIPPTASSFIPTDESTGVLTSDNLVINFSEPVKKESGNISIKKLSDDSLVANIDVNNPLNTIISGNQLTINPDYDLEANTAYYVEIPNGVIKDIFDNNYVGITGNSTWNFTTISPIITDTTAPTVSSFTPVDNAINVAQTSNLVINFNESIKKGSGNLVIKKVSDNSVLETINVASSNITVNGSKLTINPTNNLLLNTDYYVEIGSGAIKDLAGNNYPGITGKTAWNFKSITATSGANKIIGTAGADIIDGLAGNDTITGLGSNDKLTGGDGADLLDGSAGNDTLIGSGGNDTFLVNAGNDRLTGGTGADKFTYNTKAVFKTTAVGVDTITDFVISQNDKIVLDKTTFPKITSANGTGFSRDAEFAKVNTNTAVAISGADIVYNMATGELFYNQNGTATGFGTGGKFAVLSNKPNLTENQFIIQA